MRILAVIVNCTVLLLLIVVLFSTKDTEELAEGDLALFLFALTFIIINLVALVFGDYGGWVQLYFKRKALEEKNRIDALTGNTKTEQDKDEQKR